MLYCRPISEFSLFDEFKPGEFKIVDWLRKNYPTSNDELSLEILKVAREITTLEENSKICFDADWLFFYHEFDETLLSFCDEPKSDDFVRLAYSNEQELEIIFKTLVKRNFIRTDNFMQSILLAFIMEEDHFRYNSDEWVEKHRQKMLLRSFDDRRYDVANDEKEGYLTIKPMTNDDTERILSILQKELPPSQYQIMAFYLTEEWKKEHWYTEAEREAIVAAISNIQERSYYKRPIKPGIKRTDIEIKINEIMDNTLF